MLKPIYQLRSDTKSEIVINLYKEEIIIYLLKNYKQIYQWHSNMNAATKKLTNVAGDDVPLDESTQRCRCEKGTGITFGRTDGWSLWPNQAYHKHLKNFGRSV